MYVSLDENNRINATSSKQEYLVDGFEFNFPIDFEFSAQYNYKIIDNQLIHDPLPQPKPQPSLQQQVDDLTLVVAEMVGA